MDRIVEFSNNHTLLVFALVTSFLLVIFSELRRKASGILSVETADAVNLINADGLVIDLRSAESFGHGHIVNAKNIPHDELDTKLETLKQHKSKPVIAVCDTGMNSTKAVDKLRKAGFERAFGLKGGMNSWTQNGMPVVTGKKTKSKK